MEGHARELDALKKGARQGDGSDVTGARRRDGRQQQRHDAATEEMRKEHAAELYALGSHEDAIAKAVEEALEAKARERATKEKEMDQSLQWARETHARELANARKEMADAVAAKDAEVRAAQDAHTRLLDAEAKRRADVQRPSRRRK